MDPRAAADRRHRWRAAAYVSASIAGQPFYLVPAPAAPPQLPQAAPGSGDAAAVSQAWSLVTQSTDIRAIEAFRRRYGASNQFFDHLAAARIDEVRKAEAERQRIAALKVEEDRQKAVADAQRRAQEEAKAKAAAEARRKADEEVAKRPQPGRVFRDCPDVCPEMVVVPAGEFTMGSNDGSNDEKPPHTVTIRQAFAGAKFEVTFAEWGACVAGGGCASNKSPSDQGWGKGRRPVINVSWNDAKEYVAWLSRKTGKTYRLLSEAEWEYAARAGTTTSYAYGDTITKSQAQFQADKTAEIGTFQANRFGLHDMHGNVWEWVEDNWHPSYQGAPNDGSVWSGGDTSSRVLRGGSWSDYPDDLRSAYRIRYDPTVRFSNLGFRLARTL